MRILLRVVLALGLLLLLVAGLLVFGLDSAVKAAVEKGGTHALGVATTLERASLGLLSGRLELGGLRVANPPGFEAADFLALGSGSTQVDLSSLGKHTLRVETLELGDVSVLLQRREGRSNYGAILDNLERLKGKDGEPAPEQPEGEGKRFVIGRIVIRNVTADFDLLPLGGALTRAKVTIPELVLEDVGTAEGGASLAEISGRVVRALLQASLEAGGQVLGPGLLDDLQRQLGELGAQAVQMPKQFVGELIDKLPVSAALGEQLGAGAQKALEGLDKGLEGLLSKPKPKE